MACPVNNQRLFLQQSFAAHIPLLMATRHSDQREDARVFLNGITCTVSIPSDPRIYGEQPLNVSNFACAPQSL